MESRLTLDLLIQAAYALGIGLVIGLERAHHGVARDIKPHEAPAEHGIDEAAAGGIGMRTFTLLALFGWTAGRLGIVGWPWIPPVALLVLGAMVIIQHVLMESRGLTTETAALVTFLLGLMVNHHRPLAVALALATTMLLIAKPWMHATMLRLRRIELFGTLQLLILLAIVLPLLPTEPTDPWNALPPRRIGFFVVLIAGISFVGYAANRILGERRSAGLTGLVGGLASSTALTIAMAKRGKAESMRVPGQLAVFLANAAMFVRVLVIIAVLNRALALRLAPPLAAMCALMLVGAFWAWHALGTGQSEETRSQASSEALEENPFTLIPALKWGLLLSAVLLLSALSREVLGERGTLAAAGILGLVNLDAIALALARQAASDAITMHVGTLGIIIAIVANTALKGTISLVSGGQRFGLPVALVFMTSMAGGVAVVLLWL